MLGCYDFCGHYDWTFQWIRAHGGPDALKAYWSESIMADSQIHASRLIEDKGFDGMKEYWGHTLAEEAPSGGYHAELTGESFVVEMTACPSRGFLLRNNIEFSGDYCDHCIGWVQPMMKKAGFSVRHAHNHMGQCTWEFFRPGTLEPGEGEPAIKHKATQKKWEEVGNRVHYFTDEHKQETPPAREDSHTI